MLCDVNWIAFIAAMAIVELTPGPNMGWLAALSAQQGRRIGLMAVGGITLGLSVQLLAAATGFSTFIAGTDLVFEAIRWSGVAFMLYLAWEASAETGETSPGRSEGLEGFRRGFVANLLNPKALVFYIAVVGQFAVCETSPVFVQILILGGIHIVLSVIVHAAIVLLSAGIGLRLSRWRQSFAVRAGFATCLVLVAVWIAITTQNGGPITHK